MQSPFKDVNAYEIINEQFNDIYIPQNSSNMLSSYINIYNKDLSLLDDPKNLNKTAFDTYIYIQNKKLNNLTSDITYLQTNAANNVNTPIAPVKAMKSMYNSQMINLEEYPEPSSTNNNQSATYKGNGASSYPNYLIYGNRGCLEYSKGSPNVDASWDFKPCNSNNQKQVFYNKQINNTNDYNTPITNSKNTGFLLNSDNSSLAQYGFYTVNPSIALDQCLQLNNDGLSVMPCTMESSQRFKPSYHTVLS